VWTFEVADMRHDLDAWNLFVKAEGFADRFSRFLTAFDELRARLAPSRYPNLEISDEGCLWFNIDTSIGTVEIIGFPFGFRDIKTPSVMVSFPRESKDVDSDFLNRLHQIAASIDGASLFAGESSKEEELAAYRQNTQPPLNTARKFDEVLDMKRSGVFFSYLGISFGVAEEKVSEVEKMIKDVLFRVQI
jgi:hypothetical protein